MSAKSNLLEYLRFKGIKKTEFYRTTGLSNGFLDKNQNISSDNIETIISNYTDIDLHWLITGKGEMLKDNSKSTSLPEVNFEYKGAPYYNVDFIGGFDLVLNNQTTNPDYYINFEPYNKPGVIWCNITGHSMEPELSNGDYIALKEMTDPVQYLPYGEIYAIVTESYRTVKRIGNAEQKDFIRLIPTNKSPEYSPQDIPISMIQKVYAVLGSMHRLF